MFLAEKMPEPQAQNQPINQLVHQCFEFTTEGDDCNAMLTDGEWQEVRHRFSSSRTDVVIVKQSVCRVTCTVQRMRSNELMN